MGQIINLMPLNMKSKLLKDGWGEYADRYVERKKVMGGGYILKISISYQRIIKRREYY